MRISTLYSCKSITEIKDDSNKVVKFTVIKPSGKPLTIRVMQLKGYVKGTVKKMLMGRSNIKQVIRDGNEIISLKQECFIQPDRDFDFELFTTERKPLLWI